LVPVVNAQPSYANSGEMYRCNAQGCGRVSFSTGSYLFVSVSATDRSCNGKGFATVSYIYNNGGTQLQRAWTETREGCNTGSSLHTSFNAAQLQGNRSGYLTISLCHKVVVGWSCTGDLDAQFWNF
jgi:hypothetical protein